MRDDDDKGEFAVTSVRQIDAATRGFIAKTITVGGMFALTLTVVVLAVRGDSVRLTATVGVIGNLLSFLLGSGCRARGGASSAGFGTM